MAKQKEPLFIGVLQVFFFFKVFNFTVFFFFYGTSRRKVAASNCVSCWNNWDTAHSQETALAPPVWGRKPIKYYELLLLQTFDSFPIAHRVIALFQGFKELSQLENQTLSCNVYHAIVKSKRGITGIGRKIKTHLKKPSLKGSCKFWTETWSGISRIAKTTITYFLLLGQSTVFLSDMHFRSASR